MKSKLNNTETKHVGEQALLRNQRGPWLEITATAWNGSQNNF